MNAPLTLAPYGTPGAWTPASRPYQGGHTTLRPSSVRDNGPGVDLVLGPSSASGGVVGAEIQSQDTLTTGTYSWTARLASAPHGTIQAMFAYQADYRDEWREFDLEFMGQTDKVYLVAHAVVDGQHISAARVLDLGFDAAQGAHDYSISIGPSRTIFRVDGDVVDVFDATDLKGHWTVAPTRAYANIWEPGPKAPAYAGPYTPRAESLTMRLDGADVRPGDLSGSRPIMGTERADALRGTAARDFLDGEGGQDDLRGGPERDRLMGDAGDDLLFGGRASDILVGGAGADRLEGGEGADRLWGGDVQPDLPGRAVEDAERDVFVFLRVEDSRPGAADMILDFGANDVIDLSTFDLRWTGAKAAAHGVWVRDVGANLVIEADVNGDRKADLQIIVLDGATLSRDDFLL